MSCLARDSGPVSATRAATARMRSHAADTGGSDPAGTTTPVSGSYTPADLRTMYDLPAFTGTPTVAVIDVGHDRQAAADLAHYRSYFHLPACTSANGCFREVNQSGQTTKLPAEVREWDLETALDLQMVSAVCPTCHLLLVDADSSWISDLGPAIRTATRLGAHYVSMSWAGSESPQERQDDAAYLSEPNVTYVAATGDWGYAAGTAWPASGKGVIAAGGVTVRRTATDGDARDFAMTAWSGAGSGCSPYEPQPAAQKRIAALAKACSRRAQSDVSALADPATGVLVWSHGHWQPVGGTSAAAPAIAAMYAMAGNHTNADSVYGNYLARPASFRDVRSGATTSCPAGRLLCTAKAGWDGPTGLGVPLGLGGLATTTPAVPPVTLTPRSPGAVTATKGRTVRWDVRVTGRTPASGVAYAASGLPAGLRISGGAVTGTPTRTGSGTATITARPTGGVTPNFRAGRTTIRWRVVVHRIARVGAIRVGGALRRGRKVSAVVGTFRRDSRTGAVVHPHLRYTWYAGGRVVGGAHARTLTLRSGWKGKRVWFKVTASGTGLVTTTFVAPRSGPVR